MRLDLAGLAREESARMMRDGEAANLPALRVKNKFAVRNSSEYDGYRDLMISVLYTGQEGLRIIGEVGLTSLDRESTCDTHQLAFPRACWTEHGGVWAGAGAVSRPAHVRAQGQDA
eukprot:2129554-Rhodomonas_salina.1